MSVIKNSKIGILTVFFILTYNGYCSFAQVGNITTNNPTIYHIIMYGQSLMLGTRSVPILSGVQKYSTLMFKGGVRSGYDVDTNYYGALVPLVEKISISPASNGKLGETPASGFSETFTDLLLHENRFSYDTRKKIISGWDGQLLISSPAQGSTAARNLVSGDIWVRFKKDIQEGYKLSKQAGRKYNVPLILWNQGERDIDIHTSPEVYKSYLKEFQKKADAFIKSVTGQKNNVKLILYQTSSHNVRKSAGNPEIANAQYELAKAESNITMSNTTYQLPYASDNVHLSNIGSKWNGANHALAAKRILLDKIDWRPLYVKNFFLKDNIITLNFHVPVPPLVFDGANVTNPGNYGFRVFDKNDEELQINKITLSGDNVNITVNEKLTRGCYVWYGNNGTKTGAISGARGNLRDSQGEKINMNINGQIIRIDNWAPIFKEVILKN